MVLVPLIKDKVVRMGLKAKFNPMLLTRDEQQNKRKKRGEMPGKYLSSIESKQKESNWQHFKVEFRVKSIIWDKEGYFILIKGSFTIKLSETCYYLMAKYMKQKLEI